VSRRYPTITLKLDRAEDAALSRLARRYPQLSACALIRMAIRVLDEVTAPLISDDDGRHGAQREAATRAASQHETPSVVVTSPSTARFMHRTGETTTFLTSKPKETP
jgi:hypothetical protein